MSRLALLAATFAYLLLGCSGCGSDPDSVDPGAGPVASSPLRVATTGPAAPSLELAPGQLCFAVTPAARALYPDLEEVAVETMARWGRELVVSDACPSRLDVGPMRTNPDGTVPSAVHRPLVQQDGAWLPSGLGGASEIVLSDVGGLSLETPAECDARWSAGGEPAQLLRRVLTHEFGHLFGLGEDREDQGAAMYFATMWCVDNVPTAAEIRGIQEP